MSLDLYTVTSKTIFTNGTNRLFSSIHDGAESVTHSFIRYNSSLPETESPFTSRNAPGPAIINIILHKVQFYFKLYL